MISKITTTYGNLYSEIKKSYTAETLSMFFPIVGKQYRASEIPCIPKTEHPRLMVVGRCVNGWTEMPNISIDEFKNKALLEIQTTGFTWLRNDGCATDTYIRASDGKECRYNINRSAFWRSIRYVLKLLKPCSAFDERWFEHIVWSNLYPVAPRDAGNADYYLKQAQLTQCKQLLLQHIEFFDPTHILFITDWNEWFDDFSDLFNVKKTGNSTIDNVVGVGMYNNRKIVVSIRPDRTIPNKPNEIKFAEDIARAF